jgi:two-component system nitrogen regulation sensor histidine kinase NtrY
MALLVLIGRRLALRRAGDTTARLHVRLVFFFSLVAAIPTLLVSIFASVLFQSGVEFWFSDNSRRVLENANELARGYYDQNQRDVASETITMAGDLRHYLQGSKLTSPEFPEFYSYQVVGRDLNESAILQRAADGKFRIAAIVDPDQNTTRDRITPGMLKRLDAGENVVVDVTADRIEAVTPVDRQAGIYLYTARGSDAQRLSLWKQAQQVLQDYDMQTGNARKRQLQFNLALFLVSLALVGLAIWFALRFADR